MTADTATTPLMRQYHAIKQQVPGALLMFRLGDFYELFFDDAILAAARTRNHPHRPQQGKRRPPSRCAACLIIAPKATSRASSAAAIAWRSASRWRRPAPARNSSAAKSPASSPPAPRPTPISSAPTKTTISPLSPVTAPAPAWLMLTSPPANSAPPNSTSLELPGLLESIGARELLVAAEAPLFPTARTQTLDRHRTRRLGLQRRLFRPHPARTLPSAHPRWLRSRRQRTLPSRPPAPFSTTFATPSAPRSTISIRRSTSTAPTPWFSMPSPSAISN